MDLLRKNILVKSIMELANVCSENKSIGPSISADVWLQSKEISQNLFLDKHHAIHSSSLKTK